jgi:hypothetical protein
MAMWGDNDDAGASSSSQSLTPSPQQPNSSSSTPCCSTDAPESPSIGFRALNWAERSENDGQGHSLQQARNFIVSSPLEFNAILEKPESAISGVKFNFTPTVDQLSHLTNRLPFLRNLDLSDTDVTNHEIVPLVALNDLEYLGLSSTNVRNVEAVFRSGEEKSTNAKAHSDIFRPSSHPNLSINLQYTIRIDPVASRKISDQQQVVDTPEELYKILNRSRTQFGDLTLSFTPSLKQLEHIVMTQSNLWFLNLSGTDVTDVSPLSGLKRLEELQLGLTGVTDLSFICPLARLTRLGLHRTGVTNIRPLSGLLALEDLDLSDTAITDVSPLSPLLALRDLNLSGTRVVNLAPLSGLLALEDLDLDDTPVTDVSPLFELPVLEDLKLSGTAVIDVSALALLPNLKYLSLSGTAVTDVSHLPGQLLGLFLSRTAITDVSHIPDKVQRLSLGETKITDISSLVRLKDLWDLNLNGTVITDVGHLAALRQLWTNMGMLKRELPSIAIEQSCYDEMLKKIPLTERPLTKATDIYLRRIVTQAAEYLRSSKPMSYPHSEVPYDSQTKKLCLQRASYEVKRCHEILNNIKVSEEFTNLSSEEGHYASWIRAGMLASIEGRLVVVKGQNPSPDIFSLAQTEFAEKELQSNAYFQDLHTKGFSEETARMYQLLCLRYLCAHGAEPKQNISEALKDISCEIMSRDSHALYSPHKRTFFSLEEADRLYRGFVFPFYSFREGRSDDIRYYNRPDEASHMLQTYRGNSHLSLFDRLWLKLFPELRREG